MYVSTNKTYYVANSSTGTTNEQTSTHEFDLAAGTWYINPNGSDVTVTKIEFLTPSASDAYGIYIGKDNDNYSLENLTNTSGTTWSKTLTLDAGSYYEFKVKKTPSAGEAVWYGNNGRILASVASWQFETGEGINNCKLYTSVAGSYTFSWDASNNKLTITYPAGEHPTKRVYMRGGESSWCGTANTKYFVHSWNSWGANEYDTQVQESTCDGYYADIIWYNDYFQFTRNSSAATAYNNNVWNYSQDLTYDSSKPLWTCTGYTDSKGNFTSSAYSIPTYSISYAAGSTTATGGAAISGSKANESKTCGVDFTLPSSAVFTAIGYTQTGWTTSDGGAQTHALGGSYTDNAAQTFYPVWTANQYTVTHTLDGVTKSSGATGANAATYGTNYTAEFAASSGYALPETITVTIGGSTKTAGTEYTWDQGTGTVVITGSYITGNIVITVTGESTAALTALECNTLYTPANMLPSGKTISSSWQYDAYGLSGNTKFFIVGNGGNQSTAEADAGIVEIKTGSAVTISGTGYSNYCYFKKAPQMSGTTPTSKAIKFILSGSGSLDVYGKGELALVKEGGSPTTKDCTGTPSKVTWDNLTAGTYYLYATGTSRYMLAMQFNCCTTPAAPTAFAAGSITSTGATFTITDAAGAASYDIYYSTSNDAPNASTPATTTSTSETKAVTGLTAETDYYAWVRSVCDASHKSDWVALTSPTAKFTTSAAAALNDGCWDPANTAADKLTSGDVTLTTFENNFSDVEGITSVTIQSKGTDTGQCSGSDKSDGYIKVKNASSSGTKIITIVTTTAKDITIGGKKYGDNTGSFYLVKSTDENTKLANCNTNAEDEATNCPAGTYYVYAKADTKSISFSKLCISDAAPDVTAPTFVSSVPANGATGVATSGTIVLTFSEALGTVDASKFTLTGATKGAVAIDGSDATKVNIAYSGAANEATVTLETDAAAVSDLAGNALAAALSDISFTTAAAAPATKDIYYGAITITAGALTKGSTGTSQFFTNIGGTIANNTEISWSSGPGTGGEYYESNVLTDTELSKSSNWNTSSGSNRYVGGMKFQSGSTYTLALGSKIASSITFYGRNGSASKTMTVGGEDWTSSATKNTFAKHEFIKTGGFTGDVSITQDGDFYGILVITIQTATPCTTPVIPTLSNQTVCPGSDIAAWNATQTAVLADGETASYSWKKKGNDTEIEDEATLDLGAATESMAGTYVVTVTVSKAGKASATATKEVTLTVTAAVEEPVITANKATVYPGNSVTLTATCGTDGVTWNWYLCANADGTGAGSSLGTSSSYTIASADAAGTYYYKAVATGSCGTAERVYTLTVTAASECEKYFWFVNAADATTNGVVNNRDGFFTGAPTGSSNSSTYKFTLDGTEYKATKNTGSGSFSISFTIPGGSTATMGINCKGSSSKPLYLTHSSGTPQKLVSNSSSNASCTVENITEGTWTLTSAGSWTLAALGVQVCTTSTCTDATPTIAAANTTVCVGSELSIAATGYETGATFQWQKLNGSAWDNISGAESATYTVTTAAAEHAGSYRLVATKGCARTSNTVTISVPSAPNFGSTVPASVSVMQTIALSINTVEATDAVKYKWYKSADATWDAGDTEIGTNKELIKAYDSEAIGNPSYYIFCRAQNACGITTSTAIAVNVTAYVEEDCATRGNESDAEFGFEYSAGQATYNSTACWSMNDNSKKLIYAAPDGKYFKTMKVTIASSKANKASYRWSTNGGTSYTGVAITGLTTTLTEKTINLSAHGNVNSIQIGRNFDDKGESSGTLYVSKICFEYTAACTATTVTPSTSSVNYEMDGAWSNPTFTVKHGETAFDPQPTLSYSSSNEDIASVDDDGTVTFNGEAGTVTITASYAGGTISETEYCASSGSYTIIVSCPGGAPKVVADGSVNMSGCNSSVILNAKTQAGADFADGTYQWFRNGEEIDGATSSSYTAKQAGTYTVERTNTSGCTTPSTNSAIVTSTATEPEIERLVPFQYYHVDKTYSDQMKMRHLFAVKNSGTLDGKHFKMYVSRNGSAATDVTSSNALVVVPNGDGHVDTVMIDLNKLSGKYNENDELVYTCKAIDCSGNVSDVYKNTITMNVIGSTPTLALICSGSNEAGGTRDTKKLTVGGDFLTGYNKADLCQQTGNTSFNANIEWGLYTDLKTQYIVTPVNGYAVFNKLNYEPFDILLLTDYPKSSKSEAAQKIIDDMAVLCDYRPLLSFKTHFRFVTDKWDMTKYTKWEAKGFTTSPVVTKSHGKLNLNIVCYAHPMFEAIKTGEDVYEDADNTSAPLVYTMLTGEGYEGSKGMQGFEIAAAENFVTIGLTHYNATIAKDGLTATWTPESDDRMLVTVAERQTNIEARMILFSLNCGAQSKLTDKGEQVVLACLNYLLETDPLKVADCSFTFDNGKSNEHDASWYSSKCPSCTGTKGDGKWSTAANWGPDYRLLPGEFTSVRIKKPVEVDMEHAHVMSVRILEDGQITIPAGKALDVKSTIRRMDGTEISPTEVNDIHIGSASTGNGTLIFNNNTGDTKAQVDMYSTAKADMENMSAATSTWQYIGTPHTDVANARSNYYGSWLYQYVGGAWTVIPNGGPLVAFRGYCITNETAPIVYDMAGTLAATTSQDIAIPAGYTVIANSWVAPIDINAITDDDMEGISDKAIYFFNTGSDSERTGAVTENATGDERWAAGTYVTIPIHSAPYTGTDDHIPSMQGFYVWSTTAGTLHLDYDRHVRGQGRGTIVSGRMHAPKRVQTGDNEPEVLKIIARGNHYDDRLVVLEREDYTRRYDSGWDGEAWGGSDLSPMVYITNEAGVDEAVSAIPEFEGTVITFRAGEDSEYRFEFVYSEDAEPLYLFDTENNTYTQIMTGNAYYFTTSDKAPHSRFILTRKAPQIATGTELTSDGEGANAKKLLIEDKMYILLNGMLYDATGKVVK
ncbi:MAG: Ig-like domain-containing protein [Paludibacteraceae bacterium]|nr:Ig-like domain-containing protein [Paludibacteraceae bacterium]